jgi:KUP system potassium uptake protein
MVVWFITIATLGFKSIAETPEILMAINPVYGLGFLYEHGLESFLILGSVVLAVTGGEALYADMGHFGKLPIQAAWFVLVLPALAINYLGQAALLLGDPESARNPFFLMLPSWGVIPMVCLATAATVIASQAVISGVFSLVRQAIQLGLLPRLAIKHTSGSEEGQIYIPRANWALLFGVIILVLGFRSSSNLAAAYGIAVTGTMAITTILALVVARQIWKWPKGVIYAVGTAFLTVDLTFFGSNVLKIPNGGWFPLVVGCAIFIVMITWKDGRQILGARLAQQSMPLEDFLSRDFANPAKRVLGTAVFLTGNPSIVPVALLHNLKHNKVMHERVVLMTVLTERVPHVPARDRMQIEDLGQGFFRMIVRYGFIQEPDIPVVLKLASTFGMEFEMMQTSFYLGRETFASSANNPAMAPWREKMFIMMSRNALAATEFFRIPPGRVVELGTQVQL